MPAPWTYGIHSLSMKFVAATAAAVITTAIFATMSAPSHAADLETHTATVRYDDLDLHTQAGAATLEHRIAGAVATVCRAPDSRSLDELQHEAACRRTATAETQPRLQAVLASAGQPARFGDAEMLAQVPSK